MAEVLDLVQPRDTTLAHQFFEMLVAYGELQNFHNSRPLVFNRP
jgi:hypothetical protein